MRQMSTMELLKEKKKKEKDPHELIWFPGYIKWRYQSAREYQQYSSFFKVGIRKHMCICSFVQKETQER